MLSVVRHLVRNRSRKYVIDWDSIYLDRERFLELKNPYHTYAREAERFLKRVA